MCVCVISYCRMDIDLSIHLSNFPSIKLSIYPSIYPSIYLPDLFNCIRKYITFIIAHYSRSVKKWKLVQYVLFTTVYTWTYYMYLAEVQQSTQNKASLRYFWVIGGFFVAAIYFMAFSIEHTDTRPRTHQWNGFKLFILRTYFPIVSCCGWKKSCTLHCLATTGNYKTL